MSARAFLGTMRARGVAFFAEGGRLRWFASSQLSPDDLARASSIKVELLALVVDPTLEALCADLPPDDALALREERAAILEHEAGMSQTEAELRAGMSVESRMEVA